MSSFKVTNKNYNVIAGYLYSRALRDYYEERRLRNATGLHTSDIDFMDKLISQLERMNIEALYERYEDRGSNEGIYSAHYELTATPDKYQILKSLQCYLYQCAEGSIVEWDLYKYLRDIERKIMHEIVTSTPEYEEALWE